MALFWLVLVIFMLGVILTAIDLEETDHLEPRETIRAIGAQARREAQDLSTEVLLRAIELLTHKRK